MFGFIKKIFSGIINFITGIFGKKKEGFYLQIDESENNVSTAPKKAEQQKSQPAKTEAAKEEKKPEPVKTEAVKEEKKTEPVKTEAVKPEPKKTQPAAATASNNGKVEPQQETTFAPQYLAPTSTRSRRRPGPSLNTFKDMARQVNTR